MTDIINPETGEITIAPSRPKMPPEIAKAIVAVMATIKPLEKDGDNKFQKYKYVSVDQFYELVGRAMASAGIFLMAFENKIEVHDRGNASWLSVVFDLFVYHESGAEFGPIQRTTQVVASGPQSYASAQSFVEKYFLRALFKIPTGDSEPDAEEKRTLPAAGAADGKARADAKLAFLERAKIDISVIKDVPTLEKWWEAEDPRMLKIFDGTDDPMFKQVQDVWASRGKAILAAAKTTKKTEEVPFEKGPTPASGTPPRPSINVLRLNYKDALREAKTEDEAQAAYIKWIEPHEAAFSAQETEEFSRFLRTRLGEVSTR